MLFVIQAVLPALAQAASLTPEHVANECAWALENGDWRHDATPEAVIKAGVRGLNGPAGHDPHGHGVLFMEHLDLLLEHAEGQVLDPRLASTPIIRRLTERMLQDPGRLQGVHAPSLARVKNWVAKSPLLPELSDVVLREDGTVWTMNHCEAEKYRADPARDSRLPTAFEYALVAKENGAVGPVEPKPENFNLPWDSPSVVLETAQKKTEGYTPRFALNERKQKVVDFYYKIGDEYTAPPAPLGNNWFWSSSVHPDLSGAAYYLNGYNGGIYFGNRSNLSHFAVRCVVRR